MLCVVGDQRSEKRDLQALEQRGYLEKAFGTYPPPVGPAGLEKLFVDSPAASGEAIMAL